MRRCCTRHGCACRADTRREEHAAAVDDVLDELRLTDHRDTPIDRLSGGQRKRVACGVELIGKPTMLLLDEPTSGLDPALERRLMLTFRRLADSGRGIVVVTHATSSLSLCDTVAVMGQGGHLLFAGSPRRASSTSRCRPTTRSTTRSTSPSLPRQTARVRPPPARRGPRTRLLSGRSLLKHTADPHRPLRPNAGPGPPDARDPPRSGARDGSADRAALSRQPARAAQIANPREARSSCSCWSPQRYGSD